MATRINSRRKGKRGELLFVKECKKHGFDVRRGQQYSGLGGADVVGLEGIHVEVKFGESVNTQEAMTQSIIDCFTNDDIPIVALKRKYKSWKIFISLANLIYLNGYGRDPNIDFHDILVEMKCDDWFKVYKNWLKEIKH